MGCSSSSAEKAGDSPNEITQSKRLTRFKRISIAFTNATKIKKKTDELTGFILGALISNPFFSLALETWNSDEIDKLVASLISYRIQVEQGEVIMDIGDTSKDVLMIGSGSVELLAADGGFLRASGSGDLIGEIGFLTGTPRTERYVATRQCVLYRLTTQNFEAITDSIDFVFRRHPLLIRVRKYDNTLIPFVKIVKFSLPNDQDTTLISEGEIVDEASIPWITGNALCVVLKGKIIADDTVFEENAYFQGEAIKSAFDAVATVDAKLMIIEYQGLNLRFMNPVMKVLAKQKQSKGGETGPRKELSRAEKGSSMAAKRKGPMTSRKKAAMDPTPVEPEDSEFYAQNAGEDESLFDPFNQAFCNIFNGK